MTQRPSSSTTRSEDASPEPRRCRILRTPSSPDHGISDNDLAAAHRDSFRAERARLRDAICRATGGDIMRVVAEGLRNMSSSSGRRRVLSLLGHHRAGQ